MSVTTTRYIRKPIYVDAIQVTGHNIDEVAAWCQGDVKWEESPGNKGTGKKYIRVRVVQPKNVRQTKAFVGDWILYTDKGYKVYTSRAFELSFDESPEALEAEFISDDPNIVVIGPQCFAMADGSVLNWKGENYVKQEAGTPVYTDSETPHGHVKEGNGTVEEAVALEEQRGEGLQAPVLSQGGSGPVDLADDVAGEKTDEEKAA